MTPPHVLGAAEVRERVGMREAVDAVRKAIFDLDTGLFTLPPRLALGDGRVLVMSAFHSPTATAVVKTISVELDRTPAITGSLVWIGYGDQLVVDAPAVTALRTGAIVGVATDALAAPDACRMALIGAGTQAPDQVRAVGAVRKLSALTVFNPRPERAHAMLAELAPELPGVSLRVAGSVNEAIDGADIVNCATSSRTPLFDLEALPERVHVNAIGSFRPSMRELPDELLGIAHLLVVEQRSAAIEEAGEIIHGLRSGSITESRIMELAAVLHERPEIEGRTVFKSVGIAVQDWAIANLLTKPELGSPWTARTRSARSFEGVVRMQVRVLNQGDVRRLISAADALTVVREAFIAMDRGRAVMPQPLELHLPDRDGELHVKGACLLDAPVFAVKSVSGFYRNNQLGLPVSDGLTMVHDARTGMLRMLILDGGLLTTLRTAAAGALAADLLARRDARTAAVIGAGSQARYQLQALLEVRQIREVAAYSRRREATEQYADDMSRLGVPVVARNTIGEAVAGADIIITATPSTGPLLRSEWLAPGTHVTAVGSDMPHKQELDPGVLAAADKYVPDSIEAAARSGELHHAIASGLFDVGSVYGELAAVASGRLPGREREDELTVADLTGLGIQDAAVAAFVTARAEELRAGEDILQAEA
jgi:ornithine cyclodeaminase